MNAAGAQSALVRLMAGLRARGHVTETWFFYQEQDTFADHAGVKTFHPKAKLSAIDYAGLLPATLQRLRAFRPDAVITFLPLACIVGQAAAALAGVKRRVASLRTPPSTYSAPLRTLDRAFGAMGVYTDIVAVSNGVRNDVATYPAAYRKKLSVVHNGIDWTPSPLSAAEARSRFGIPDDAFLLVASGRMKAQKRYSAMLDIVHAQPGVRLAIAGDGPLQRSLAQQRDALGLTKRVTFLGALKKAEMPHLLRAADAFIQTSGFEGQSNAILEAMHEGLPILASDIPTQRETLCDGNGAAYGVLAPLDDQGAWVAALVRLQQDAAYRAALAEGARSHVEKSFTLNAMIDGFERIALGQAGSRAHA
ncbi:MAG: glycosyltransferase [Hyphomonadaceae bacterium]|nr:glycosyltransferase [Hyphomonadaceae bacterium]